MIFGVLESVELTTIVAGVLIVAGFIYWRIRMGRTDRGEERENPD